MALPAHRLAAIALEEDRYVALARAGIQDADVVVRTRAPEVLAKESPKDAVAHAVALLRVPNDPFRFRVCEVPRSLRQDHPDPPESRTDRAYAACVALARRIHAAVEDPSPVPDPYDDDARERLLRASR